MTMGITSNPWPVTGLTTTTVPAGSVGELLKSTIASGAAIALVNGTPKNLTSLDLTAGIWDVWTQIDFTSSAATATIFASSVSPTTNTLGLQTANGIVGEEAQRQVPVRYSAGTTAVYGIGCGPVRVTATVAATIYAVGQANFTAGTLGMYGTFFAARVA